MPLEFQKKQEGKHVYSAEHDGVQYEVRVNKDKKTWTATRHQPDTEPETLGASFPTRTEAVAAAHGAAGLPAPDSASETANPAPGSGTEASSQNGSTVAGSEGADKAAKPKKGTYVSKREHDLLGIIKSKPSVTVPEAATEFGDQMTALGLIATMGRRGWITVENNVLAITKVGLEMDANYVSPTKQAREKKEKGTGGGHREMSEEARAAHEARMIEKHGPRPEGIGPAPTRLEYEEARLANATASLAFATIAQRKHPWSARIAKKIKTSQERIDVINEKIAKLKSSGTGDQIADGPEDKEEAPSS